jgi:hypothetical protein
MQEPKRQIIKTRPQRPYIVARIILIVLVVLALAFTAWELFKPHPAHALVAPVFAVRQEAPGAARRATVRIPMGSHRS